MGSRRQRKRTLEGGKRWALALLVAVFGTTLSLEAFAGSYLDRAGLLVRQGRSEADYLEYRVRNRELAEVVHRMATARLSAAREMPVPKEVTQAHPHIL